MTQLPDNNSPVDSIGPGTRLREWEIVGFRGRGSYGVVFEARRSSWLDAPHRAVKVFDPLVSAAARGALVEEFAALTGLRHPHLLEGTDAFDLTEGPYAGCVVFVLELAEEDLATWTARAGRPAPGEVAAVGSEVAAGLAALHGHGRVHGDVKPENILRSADRWVLGDFGVTGLLEGSYAVTPGATIDYRPPELADAPPGGRLHRSTDVWALGVALHVAATGRHPFPGPDPMLRYAAVVRDDRADVPDLDTGLGAVLDRACLARDPRDRLGALELADELAALAAELAGDGPSEAGSDARSEAGGPETGPSPTAPAVGSSPTATGPGGAPTVNADDPGTTPAPRASTGPGRPGPAASPTVDPDAAGTVPSTASSSTGASSTAASSTGASSAAESSTGVSSSTVTGAVLAAVLAVLVAQMVGQAAALPDLDLGVQRGLYVVVSVVVLVIAVETGGRWWGSRQSGSGRWWARSRPVVGAAGAVGWLAATAVVFGLV